MAENPLVSILIPVYNAQNFLAETLESCLAQTHPNIEIIMVDDGSSDASLSIARVYEEKHANIRVLTQENSGAPSARNLAFSQAKGTYIQYIDADDLMSPNKVAAQMALAERHGKSHVYFSRFSYFVDDIATARLMRQKLDRSFDSALEWLIAAWSGEGFGVVMGWLTHRALIERAGPWNEALLKNQDGEFFSRVLLLADRAILSEETMVYYRISGSGSISAQLSHAAAASTLTSLKLYESNCAGINNLGVPKALAYNFLRFIEYYYPRFPDLIHEAEMEIRKLGFNYFTLPTPGKLRLLSKAIGSKNVIRLRHILRKRRGH